MWTYIVLAATAWWLGFFPFVEIYIAIPATIAMGLDYVSAGVWSAVGNFTAVPLIIYGHAWLVRIPKVGPWIDRLGAGRAQRIMSRHGPMFVVLVTPWIGVWAIAAAAITLGMPRGRLMIYAAISIAAYAAILTVGIALGVDFFTRDA